MLNNDQKMAFKMALKQACLNLLHQRLTHANLAIQEAQASANSQEKSSAGDKYETARAMGQIDREMNTAQWMQAKEEYQFLEGLVVNTLQNRIAPGVVIELNNTIYFAAVGLGSIQVGDKKTIAISCKSPLFQELRTKKSGDIIRFNKTEQLVTDVY